MLVVRVNARGLGLEMVWDAQLKSLVSLVCIDTYALITFNTGDTAKLITAYGIPFPHL